MKAILVIDKPKDCFTCELGGSKVCIGGCPLKPMPTRVEHEEGLDSAFNIGWEHGYNACLDDLGETE